MVEVQIHYPWHRCILENVLVLQALKIIVQTIIHHHSKVFATSQARVSPEYVRMYVCTAGRQTKYDEFQIFLNSLQVTIFGL